MRKLTTVKADWGFARAEAEILTELLPTAKPNDPSLASIIERASELQRLGWEMRHLLKVTEDDARRMD